MLGLVRGNVICFLGQGLFLAGPDLLIAPCRGRRRHLLTQFGIVVRHGLSGKALSHAYTGVMAKELRFRFGSRLRQKWPSYGSPFVRGDHQGPINLVLGVRRISRGDADPRGLGIEKHAVVLRTFPPAGKGLGQGVVSG